MEKEVLVYQTPDGKQPFSDWLFSLKDNVTSYRIESRLKRIRYGNYGDHKRFNGLIEVRMDFGKGYRLYCMEDGEKIVILLIAGDKSSQEKDIKIALNYRRDYHEQNKI